MIAAVQLNNYFGLHVCLSLRAWVGPYVGTPACHTLEFSVASQNVTNKSSLVCVKSENWYEFWVALILLGSMWQDKAELRTVVCD